MKRARIAEPMNFTIAYSIFRGKWEFIQDFDDMLFKGFTSELWVIPPDIIIKWDYDGSTFYCNCNFDMDQEICREIPECYYFLCFIF